MLGVDSPVRRNSINIPDNNASTRRGCIRTRSFSVPGPQPKPLDILTRDQKSAFREVFDLFDSNGGGSIDAEELEEALRSADIYLTKEEISEVLSSMDKDGNGEIDFEEFLQLMTNTERFLESVMCKDSAEARQREVLLFEALTQFMKKSALHSINEIVGYYHNKYKKVQAPHVIRHYAAGARLIGLSEQQIRRHLDQLRKSSADNKSPYAHPPYAFALPIFYGNTPPSDIKKKVVLQQNLAEIAEESSPPLVKAKISEKIDLLVPKLRELNEGGRGKIRLKIVWNGMGAAKTDKPATHPDYDKLGHRTATNISNTTKTNKKYNGWVAQRFNPSTVREHLPVLTNNLIKQQIKEEKKICEIHQRNVLDFDDMTDIRRKVKDLAKVYYARIQTQKCERASNHWCSMAVEEIPSLHMRNTFERAFKAYTGYKNTPISSLCSRSLA